MKLKLNQDLRTPSGKLLEGAIIEVECDKESTPLDMFWRNRLKDAAIDNCVEIVSDNIPNEETENCLRDSIKNHASLKSFSNSKDAMEYLESEDEEEPKKSQSKTKK